jgi:hypothetical protein
MSMTRGIAATWFAVCAGCVDLPASAEADGSGVSTDVQTQTVHCGSSATLERYLAGGGGMEIQISDGAHRMIYQDAAGVAGEVNDSRELDGAAGAWTFSVDPAGFAGQFKITLQCHAWFVGDAAPPGASLGGA